MTYLSDQVGVPEVSFVCLLICQSRIGQIVHAKFQMSTDNNRPDPNRALKQVTYIKISQIGQQNAANTFALPLLVSRR